MQVGASAVCELRPPELWRHFWRLTQIPRPSGHEQRVCQYLKDLAVEKGLEWTEDKTGNLLIKKPASGLNGRPAPNPVLIQGHVDMVCEKNRGIEHDFFTDGLKLAMDGEWLKAEGTTLGADNGIGVAAALALLDTPSVTPLPPLELLFTVDEERGLKGANKLDASALGISARSMLNLDTEMWGEVCIGCSGGGDARLTLKAELEPQTANHQVIGVTVSGLLGGHSGLNINEYRGNAIKWAAGIAKEVISGIPSTKVVCIKGGDKRNAIPREASVMLSVPQDQVKEASGIVERCFAELREEYSRKETEAQVTVSENPDSHGSSVLTYDSQYKLLSLLTSLPHGPHKFSHVMPELVETSCNLASIAWDDASESHLVGMSVRSSLHGALERLRGQIVTIGELCGAGVVTNEAYPGWDPNPDSPVVSVVADCFEKLEGKKAEIVAIHAGLECGILGKQIPGMDMVSYGPTITGAHSPDERVHVPSVDRFWQLTLSVLEKLSQG